jgi:hypothetical protein
VGPAKRAGDDRTATTGPVHQADNQRIAKRCDVVVAVGGRWSNFDKGRVGVPQERDETLRVHTYCGYTGQVHMCRCWNESLPPHLPPLQGVRQELPLLSQRRPPTLASTPVRHCCGSRTTTRANTGVEAADPVRLLSADIRAIATDTYRTTELSPPLLEIDHAQSRGDHRLG